MSTPPDDEYDLRLPAGTAGVFEKDIAEIPVEKRRYWRFHQVQEGDTLASLARTWHVSQSELAYVNQLKPDADLDGVDSVIIPQAPTSDGSAAGHVLQGAAGRHAGDDCGPVRRDGGAAAAMESHLPRQCGGTGTEDVCVGAGAPLGTALRAKAAGGDEGAGRQRRRRRSGTTTKKRAQVAHKSGSRDRDRAAAPGNPDNDAMLPYTRRTLLRQRKTDGFFVCHRAGRDCPEPAGRVDQPAGQGEDEGGLSGGGADAAGVRADLHVAVVVDRVGIAAGRRGECVQARVRRRCGRRAADGLGCC